MSRLFETPWLSENAIVQEGRVIEIQGKAKPGSEARAWLFGSLASVESDASGHWSLSLGPFKAGERGALRVETSEGDGCFEGLAVGELWLCAGQSNMEMGAGVCEDGAEIIAAATSCELRELRQGRWRRIGEEDAACVSAIALSFAAERAKARKCPVGITVAARGGTRIESWTPSAALARSERGRRMLELAGSPEVLAAAEDDRKAFKPYGKTELARWRLGRALPCELYNSLIEPLTGVPLAGALWYQGESNAEREEDAKRYGGQLESMIRSWRAAWKRPSLPFIVVGLPRYEPTDQEAAKSWELLREAQGKAVGKAGMASFVDCFDLGDPRDIHPKMKREAGIRAALAASRLA